MSADNLEDQTLNQTDEPIIDTFDLFFLLTAGLIAILYLYKDTLFGSNNKNATNQSTTPSNANALKPAIAPPKKNKDFLMRMRETVGLFLSFNFILNQIRLRITYMIYY